MASETYQFERAELGGGWWDAPSNPNAPAALGVEIQAAIPGLWGLQISAGHPTPEVLRITTEPALEAAQVDTLQAVVAAHRAHGGALPGPDVDADSEPPTQLHVRRFGTIKAELVPIKGLAAKPGVGGYVCRLTGVGGNRRPGAGFVVALAVDGEEVEGSARTFTSSEARLRLGGSGDVGFACEAYVPNLQWGQEVQAVTAAVGGGAAEVRDATLLLEPK